MIMLLPIIHIALVLGLPFLLLVMMLEELVDFLSRDNKKNDE
jgi:hypothetical protein